jgi:hypothetical protein
MARRLRPGRGSILAAATLFLGALSSSANAQISSTTYQRLIQAYAAGRGAEAVTELSRWTEEQVTNAVKSVEATATDRELAAAAMLHTELANAVINAQAFPAAFHVQTAQSLLDEWIRRPAARQRAQPFRRRWYQFVASMCASAGELGQAAWYVRNGLLEFPDDSMLYVVQGTIVEMNVRIKLVPDLRRLPESRIVRARIEQELKIATNAYQHAADVDDRNAIAWLHLGWVNFFLEDSRAKARFDAALTRADDDTARYLAHLFLGGVAERNHRPSDAAAEYEAARALGAQYQTPYVALSRVEESLGHGERARGLALQGAQLVKGDDDPWWDFRISLDRPALVWLRAEARRP